MFTKILRTMTLVGSALLSADTLHAQVSDQLCAELEKVRPGEFFHGHTEHHLTTSTLRPMQEPASVGRSAVKGAMARRLSQELDSGPVRWSGALINGPVVCGSFHAYQVQVNPLKVRLEPH